jgi:hypothetical protein
VRAGIWEVWVDLNLTGRSRGDHVESERRGVRR